jgi:single-strand selective monofunctional uracil DNA glycosylase
MIRKKASATGGAEVEALLGTYARLSRRLGALRFAPPVALVYNPLEYARVTHTEYVRRFGGLGRGRILFLGMNPGPFGMAQTGVPFGEISAVRDWLGISGEVKRPDPEHPKRPVDGFATTRSEVSGRRLWGFFAERFGTAEAFFDRCFVANYCPLAFLEESGANRTPDKLPASEREPLFAACDEALAEVIATLEPSWVLGVGDFAKRRAELVVDGLERRGDVAPKVGSILHPSPASPRANRGWAEAAAAELEALGIRW